MSVEPDDKARRMLREANLYCTDARIAILQILMQTAKPLPQDQIARRLGGRTLHKVTVYRTLESLAAAGLVHRAFMQNRAWHFELADHCTQEQCHPHFTCTRCGVTQCMTDTSLPMARVPRAGFVIQRQQVRLEGLCPACA